MKKIIIYIFMSVLLITVVGCQNAVERNEKTSIPTYTVEVSENSTESETTEEIIPEGVQILEQSFEVELNDWGKVTFAPFAPKNPSDKNGNVLYPDVKYYLLKNDQAVCKFGAADEKQETGFVFLGVEAVSFTDYNDDGLSDIITICKYELENKDTVLQAEVYFQQENKQGFLTDPLLNEYLGKQNWNDSIDAVKNAKDDWWYHLDGMDGSHGLYAQIQIIADNVSLWKTKLDYADTLWQYAVTNLDLDDKSEIIVSQCGGTGWYTYSRIFEVNDTFDGLVEISTDFTEGDSQPDIMVEKVEVYWNGSYFFYIFNDSAKDGAAKHYDNKSAVSLHEKQLVVDPIVFKDSIYDIEKETLVVTVKDKYGNILPEEAYETEAAKYFEGYEKYECNIGWQDMNELSDDTEEMKQQLEESDGKFQLNRK